MLLQKLNIYKEKLAKAKNSLDYLRAFAELRLSLSSPDLNIDDVDIDQYVSTIYELWKNTPIPMSEEKEVRYNKDGSITTTIRPIFKRPTIPSSTFLSLRNKLSRIKENQKAEKNMNKQH